MTSRSDESSAAKKKRSDISDRQALEACWGYGAPENRSALAELEACGYPQKVAVAKLEQLAGRGWIECGVSIAYPWRTPKGEAELRRLRDV